MKEDGTLSGGALWFAGRLAPSVDVDTYIPHGDFTRKGYDSRWGLLYLFGRGNRRASLVAGVGAAIVTTDYVDTSNVTGWTWDGGSDMSVEPEAQIGMLVAVSDHAALRFGTDNQFGFYAGFTAGLPIGRTGAKTPRVREPTTDEAAEITVIPSSLEPSAPPPPPAKPVAITAPVDGAEFHIGTDVNVSVKVTSEQEVQFVALLCDGRRVTSYQEGDVDSLVWSTHDMSPGQHGLVADVLFSNGRWVRSDSVRVTLVAD